jgi:1-acyl-sn-glycerol-3-phosphate acyltransferase
MDEGKTGIGRLILNLNGKVPVIPLYIHGSAEALSLGKIIPRFKAPISISFCKPLSFKKYSRKNGWNKSDPEYISTAHEIVDKIMTSIRNEMIKTEKHYFTFLERKFRRKIEQIKIPESKRYEFDKYLFKLLRIHPKRIQKYNETFS